MQWQVWSRDKCDIAFLYDKEGKKERKKKKARLTEFNVCYKEKATESRVMRRQQNEEVLRDREREMGTSKAYYFPAHQPPHPCLYCNNDPIPSLLLIISSRSHTKTAVWSRSESPSNLQKWLQHPCNYHHHLWPLPLNKFLAQPTAALLQHPPPHSISGSTAQSHQCSQCTQALQHRDVLWGERDRNIPLATTHTCQRN